MTTSIKTCFKCNEEKALTEFYKHKQMADGYIGKCKECNKADVRCNYANNTPHYKEYDRVRALLPHRKEAAKEYQKTEAGKASIAKCSVKYREQNPLKRSAHMIVGNAVRDGRLNKATACEVCKEPSKLHGHHDDYSKPLSVRWLCSPCHHVWHRKNGAGLNG